MNKKASMYYITIVALVELVAVVVLLKGYSQEGIQENTPTGYVSWWKKMLQPKKLFFLKDTILERGCSDTDGRNMYTKGTVRGYGADGISRITATDSCATRYLGASAPQGKWVVEEQCDQDNKAHAYYYRCPTREGSTREGCRDGKCVGELVEPSVVYPRIDAHDRQGNRKTGITVTLKYLDDDGNQRVVGTIETLGFTTLAVEPSRPFNLKGQGAGKIYGDARGSPTQSLTVRSFGDQYFVCETQQGGQCSTSLQYTLQQIGG